MRNEQILEEASSWFVDFRVGDIDASSREQFDKWLRQSPEHIRAYMEIARTYVELPELKSNLRVDTQALIAAARREAKVVSFDEKWVATASPPQQRGERSSSLRSRPRRRALAASLLVAAGAASIATWTWMQRFPTYATDIGENRSITLADGSTVDLNARSRVRIEFSAGERDVRLLEGQALFEVAKDAARPFIVRSGAAFVRAVGTQFDVNRGTAGTTVTVVEGRVEVWNNGSRSGAAADASPTGEGGAPGNASASEAAYVSAGQQVTVTAERVTQPRHADTAAATAWTQHRLIFEGAPLSEVVEQMNRYSTRPLYIEDAALNDFHVSGVYASTDPTSFIRFLRAQPGFEVTESRDAVRISRK